MQKNPGNQVPQFHRCYVTEPIVARAPLREAYLGEKNSQRTPSFFSGRPNGRLQRLRSHRAALDGLVGKSTHPPPFGRPTHATHASTPDAVQAQAEPARMLEHKRRWTLPPQGASRIQSMRDTHEPGTAVTVDET